jgi:hypothetical protein
LEGTDGVFAELGGFENNIDACRRGRLGRNDDLGADEIVES